MIEFRKNWTGDKLEVIMRELAGVDILSLDDVEEIEQTVFAEVNTPQDNEVVVD